MKRLLRQLSVDVIIAVVVFLTSLHLHSSLSSENLYKYGPLAVMFYGFHFFISLAFSKYEAYTSYSIRKLASLYLRSWIYTSGIALLLIYTFQFSYLSRLVVLFNIFGLIGFELLYLLVKHAYRHSLPQPDEAEYASRPAKHVSPVEPLPELSANERRLADISDDLLEAIGEEGLYFLSTFLDSLPGRSLVLGAADTINILSHAPERYVKMISLARLNDVRYVNKFMEAINSRLPMGGWMAINAETKNQRKERILKKYPPLLNYFYYTGDFVIKRVLPKLPLGKKVYFFLTRGQNRVMSRGEILGRVVSCGFTIVEEKKIDGRLYVIAKKTGEPAFNEHATYGPLIYLNRIGKDRKPIKVYKFRTMHPYSEYLQAYIFENNNLDEGGKIKDDYRVTRLGRIMRSVWIDELPMFYNVLRGEMKLVGVRPLSNHYFGLYCPEMQELRTSVKPGLVPPFYVDMPKTIEEIEASERRYLEAYLKSPFKTDVSYFFRAFYNIIFRKARSK